DGENEEGIRSHSTGWLHMADPWWLRMGDPAWLTMGDPGWLSFPDPGGSSMRTARVSSRPSRTARDTYACRHGSLWRSRAISRCRVRSEREMPLLIYSRIRSA